MSIIFANFALKHLTYNYERLRINGFYIISLCWYMLHCRYMHSRY